MKKYLVLFMAFMALATSQSFAKGKPAIEGVLNVNTASVEELTQLPGIGPSKAQAIVTFRQEHPFKDVSELAEVKGIGPKMLEKIRGYLTIEGSSTLKAVSASSVSSAATTAAAVHQ